MKYPMLPELVALIEASLAGSRIGFTTAIGNAAGTTFTDASLIGAGANSFVGMLVVVHPGDRNNIESFEATAFNNATGEITLNHAYKGVAAAIAVGTSYIILTFRPALTAVDQIFDIVNALLTLQETGGTLTADGNEQYVYVNESPLGEYRPMTVTINLDNMVDTEQVVIREYYRINPDGDKELKDLMTYDDADGGLADGKKIININMEPNRYGCAVTLEQTAFSAAYKTFDWDVHVKE